MAKTKKTARGRFVANSMTKEASAPKSPRPPADDPPPSPTDREVAEFKALLQTTAAASAQGISITNSYRVQVKVYYSIDNGKTWPAVAESPTVGGGATRVFDMRTILGTANQGPVSIRYTISGIATPKVVGAGWYYSNASPPVCKACYQLAKVDTGPTYAPW